MRERERRHLRVPTALRAIGASILVAVAAACGGTETVVQTVVVEKQVEKPVVQTVVVEKPVEKIVQQTVVVEKEKIVEKPVAQTVVVVQTATPTAAPIAPPPAQQGEVTLGLAKVIPPLFVPALGGVGLEQHYASWGIVEFLIQANAKEGLDPGLSMAESWTLAPDQSKVTFKIRKGVKFHGDWGEVTADDVVWSHNNALREGSTFWGISGLRTWMDTWKKVDDYTAEMGIQKGKYNPTWEVGMSNLRTHSPWIYPKLAYDRLGETKANVTPLGTGPFKVLSYRTAEEVKLEALPTHWRAPAKTKSMAVIEIPEDLARVAAFRTGETDIIEIPNKFINDLKRQVSGSREVVARGSEFPHTMNVGAGNLWALKKCDTGKDIFPRPAFTPDDKHPYIGNPYEGQTGTQLKFDADSASMKRSLKVRQALALAIDRKTIINTIFGGLALDDGAISGFVKSDPQWKKSWEIPYDPTKAKALLAEAGYPNGFEFEFYLAPDHIVINPEAGAAIAQMWRQIGLTVKIDSTAYAAARPKHFDGQDNRIWYRHSSIGNIDQQKFGNFGPSNTFDHIELPCDMQALSFANRTEPDIQKRIKNNVDLQDYVSTWYLSMTLYTVPEHWMLSSRIEDWKPHFMPGRYFTAPETLKVKK